MTVLSRLEFILAVLAALTLGWRLEARGQQRPGAPAEPGYGISVDVHMVTVPVTVRNPSGSHVQGLPRTAFQVYEDGREQEIVSFEEASWPLHIAMLLDVSGSLDSEWEDIAKSTLQFSKGMRLNDRMALITFSNEASLLLGWGRHHDKIAGVLKRVRRGGETALWDAIWAASEELFGQLTGQKTLVLMTDGLDNASSASFAEALASVLRTETSVYVVSRTEVVRRAVLGGENIWTKEFFEADALLQRLASETGGRVLRYNVSHHLHQIYRDLYEEISSQYLLRYVSDAAPGATSFRRIRVAVDYPNTRVQTRAGYYPETSLVARENARGPAVSKLPDSPVENHRYETWVDRPSDSSLPRFPDAQVNNVNPAVVHIPVTVRGRDGSFVTDLPRDSFRLLDNDTAAEITNVRGKEAPSKMILLIDGGAGMRDGWESVKRACRGFLANMRADDEYALVVFNEEVRLRVDWSRDPAKADRVLSTLYCKGKSLLLDAIWVVARDLLAGVEGKVTVVVISNGVDQGSVTSHHEALEEAVRSGAAYYMVNRRARFDLPGNSDIQAGVDMAEAFWEAWLDPEVASKITRGLLVSGPPWKVATSISEFMEAIAGDTGGRVFWGQETMNAVVGEIQEEIRNQVVVEYAPSPEDLDGERHQILVSIDRQDASVHSRKIYIAKKDLSGPGSRSPRLVLQRDTLVWLRFAETVTSRRVPGNVIRMEVYKDVRLGNLTVIPHGARAWAIVDSGTRPGGPAGRPGHLRVRVEGVSIITGHTVRLTEIASDNGSVLLPWGTDAVLEKGSIVKAYVAEDVILPETLLQAVNKEDLPRRSEMATVHVYGKDYQLGFRPVFHYGKRSWAMSGKPSLYLDGRKVAVIAQDRHLTIHLDPGRHTLETDRNHIELNLEKGREVYMRMSTQGIIWPRGFLTIVERSVGEEEMYPLDPVKEKDHRLPLPPDRPR